MKIWTPRLALGSEPGVRVRIGDKVRTSVRVRTRARVRVRVRVRHVFEPLMTTGIKPGGEAFYPDQGSLDQSRLSHKTICTGEHRGAAPVLFW